MVVTLRDASDFTTGAPSLARLAVSFERQLRRNPTSPARVSLAARVARRHQGSRAPIYARSSLFSCALRGLAHGAWPTPPCRRQVLTQPSTEPAASCPGPTRRRRVGRPLGARGPRPLLGGPRKPNGRVPRRECDDQAESELDARSLDICAHSRRAAPMGALGAGLRIGYLAFQTEKDPFARKSLARPSGGARSRGLT